MIYCSTSLNTAVSRCASTESSRSSVKGCRRIRSRRAARLRRTERNAPIIEQCVDPLHLRCGHLVREQPQYPWSEVPHARLLHFFGMCGVNLLEIHGAAV
ncbi:MAG: hypothetical protein L0G99_13295, partial [Propionibacteriales bacterium]|nr:hypothetical protein [Propionibacteriales bacterium]